ncbi:MAG: adenylosuccinate lyase [Elusimicrobiota bacterium]
MIERYSRKPMSEIWSDRGRMRALLAVETACLEAIAEEKKIPRAQIRRLKVLPLSAVLKAARAREEESGHELISVISAAADLLGNRAPAVRRYIHYGLTSSDVLDTALALQMRDSADILLSDWALILRGLAALARKHEKTWMAGRTHGIHAEPITFGVKLSGWHAEGLRNVKRVTRAKNAVSYGKLSGAVGAFTQTPPAVEKKVCAALGLKPEPVSTQVIPRDRHAEFLQALALSACAIERFALEIRHLQRTEVQELREPFGENQKGSSAMPHKKNPVLCENLCGLSRLVRSYANASLENVPLWHERDISHSSVERVILPDACQTLDFMLDRFAKILAGLVVDSRRMRENMDESRGLFFSQSVLLRLIDAGLNRAAAYDLTQAAAARSQESGQPFLECLLEYPELRAILPRKALAECFDLKRYGRAARNLIKRGGITA